MNFFPFHGMALLIFYSFFYFYSAGTSVLLGSRIWEASNRSLVLSVYVIPEPVSIQIPSALSHIVIPNLQEVLGGIHITVEVISLTLQIIEFFILSAVIVPV